MGLLNRVKYCKNYFMSKVYDWFEERLEVQAIADDISSKYVPPHVNIFYCFGGLVLTWVTGVILSVVTVSFGVTGYSLPWDQVGFWACKIVTGVPAAVPIVGPPLVLILRGGESVGQATLTRFYSAHTFVLPVAAAVLMLTH